MATTIAKLNVLLTGSVKGFTTAFSRAGSALKSFASSTAASVAAGLAIDRIVSAGANALVEFTQKGFQTIDATAKLSDRLGIATESLAGLQYAADLAGVSNEELTGGLEKMLKTIGEAEGGSDKAKKALAGIGVSLAQIQGKTPAEAFGLIADKLNGIEDPAKRAAAVMAIFGKSGQGLLPLLFEGSDGLAALQKRAEQLGLTFSRVDAAQVEAANDSLTTAGKLLEGVGQQFAIQISPFITAASDALVEFATSGTNVGSIVVDAVEWVASAIASVADWVELLKAGWQGLRAVVLGASAAFIKEIDLAGKAIVYLINLLPGMEKKWDESWSTMARSLALEAADAADKAGVSLERFADGTNSKKVTEFFDDIRVKSKQAAEAAAAAKPSGKQLDGVSEGVSKAATEIDKLKTKVEQFNMTETERAVAALRAAGADSTQAAEAEKLYKQLEELEKAKDRQKELDDEAARVMEDNLLPFEKYQKELDKLSDLLLMGKIDWDTYNRAVTKAKDELNKPVDAGNLQAPDLIQSGTAQAADLLAQIEASQTGDRQRNDERLLKETQSQTDIQESIAGRLAQLSQFNVVKF